MLVFHIILCYNDITKLIKEVKKMNKDVIDLIGNTKMVKIDEMDKETDSDIFIKLEGTNPGGSIKDRPVKKMFELAEENDALTLGDTVVEPTSGNTGIAIALISKVKGYNSILIMPDTMTQERINLMKMYGAEIILTDGENGMNGSIELAEKLRNENDITEEQYQRMRDKLIN